MCAMYYYASKLTAAALSGGGSFGGGGGTAGGGGGSAVCRCHEAHRDQQQQQQQSPKRSQQQSSQTTRHHSRTPRVNTPTLGPTTSEHVVVEHPRPNHYHRHRTKHKVPFSLLVVRLFLVRWKLFSAFFFHLYWERSESWKVHRVFDIFILCIVR